MNIYVGNLPYTVTEDDLRDTFTDFGDVESTMIVTDKESGQSKGFGFVEMASNVDAQAAITALHESSLQGRNIKVNQAKPRGGRPQRRSR